MRTIKVNVYKFHELSDDAKENALEWGRSLDHVYGWQHENIKSLKEFSKFVGGKPDWSISLYGKSWAKIKGIEQSTNSNIPTNIWLEDNYYQIEKNCPFTGYVFDEILLDSIREFMDDPDDRTLYQLAQEGAKNWAREFVNDWEYAYSDEGLSDFLESNFEFTEDGEVW